MVRKSKRNHREKTNDKIRHYGEDILTNQAFLDSEHAIQHGDVSVREHCISVARCALSISDFLPFQFHERDMVRGALLHDYFLYDWHEKKVKPEHILKFYQMHGFTHPATALANARKEFELTKREEDIIAKHMWPLTVKPPLCREAWIVTMADKYISLLETLRIRRGHE